MSRLEELQYREALEEISLIVADCERNDPESVVIEIDAIINETLNRGGYGQRTQLPVS